jgi:hypothetical protein
MASIVNSSVVFVRNLTAASTALADTARPPPQTTVAPVQRVPFIVADPRREADATRGRVDDRFVEPKSGSCPPLIGR